jgi:hypothetical protein
LEHLSGVLRQVSVRNGKIRIKSKVLKMIVRRPGPSEKKERILSELSTVRSAILAEVTVIPSDMHDHPFLGIWDLKDLLAHLAGWDVTNLAAAREILEGKLPSFYSHFDKDWASYNAALVQSHRRAEMGELIAHARDTHLSLLSFLEELPADEFYRDRGIRAGRYKVTIGRLLEAERDDERKHLEQIQAYREAIKLENS